MPPKDPMGVENQLTPKGAAVVVKLSESWLAKARMTGTGPPYSKIGRSIRYSPTGLARWLKAREHWSTSEYEERRDTKVDRDSKVNSDEAERRDGRHGEGEGEGEGGR